MRRPPSAIHSDLKLLEYFRFVSLLYNVYRRAHIWNSTKINKQNSHKFLIFFKLKTEYRFNKVFGFRFVASCQLTMWELCGLWMKHCLMLTMQKCFSINNKRSTCHFKMPKSMGKVFIFITFISMALNPLLYINAQCTRAVTNFTYSSSSSCRMTTNHSEKVKRRKFT